jgi:hypothetical protein
MIGSCHCGRVAFEVKTAPAKAFTCNCSYCVRRGWRHAYAGVDEFALLRGAEALSTYRFGAGTTQNYFCGFCGISTHFFSTYEDRPQYAYSLGCCEGFDTSSLEVEHIDGRSF